MQLAVIPAITAILGEYKRNFPTSLPVTAGYLETGSRCLLTKVEPCTQGSGAHVGHTGNLAILCSSLGIPGIATLLTLRGGHPQRAHRVAALQMRCHKGMLHITVETTYIRDHVDQINFGAFQYFIYMLINKFTGIHIDYRIFIDAMENESNTDNIVVSTCTYLQFFKIQFAEIPAIAHRL